MGHETFFAGALGESSFLSAGYAESVCCRRYRAARACVTVAHGAAQPSRSELYSAAWRFRVRAFNSAREILFARTYQHGWVGRHAANFSGDGSGWIEFY